MMTPTSIQRFLQRRAIVTLTLTAALVLSLAPSRFLAPALADDPMTVVKTTVNQALDVLRDKNTPLAQRQDKLRQIVAATFDFTEMAKSALGYHWKADHARSAAGVHHRLRRLHRGFLPEQD